MRFSDFGFKENPFSITPDPHYLFLSRGHEESLAHLIYGAGPNGGFVQLTGEVGTGKTLLVRSLLEQKLEHVDIALILNPRISRRDFMITLCEELGVPLKGPPYRLKEVSDELTRHLLKTHEQGRYTVLVVDEAQNLSPRVLEQVRLLTNLETARHKLLRIILVGQPELQQLLARKDLRQVAQRITARYHLSPLSRRETSLYIRHRLAVAGMDQDLFTPAALRLVHWRSGGVPRVINTLCERALLAVFTSDSKRVTLPMVWLASREIEGRQGTWRPVIRIGAGLSLLALAAGIGWWLTDTDSSSSRVVERLSPLAGLNRISRPVASEDRTGGAAVDASAAATADDSKPTLQRASTTPTMGEVPLEPQSRNEMTLQQKLFSLWGKRVAADSSNMCNLARQEELRCLQGVVEWDALARLNRPVLLRLDAANAEDVWLVEKMEQDRLMVDDGQEPSWLDAQTVEARWEGAFIMLWRPLTQTALLGPGSSGAAVTWLRERLAMADGEPVQTSGGRDRFDEALEARVRKFQRAQGVDADGIVGPWTMILLNNLRLPAGTPRLQQGGD